MLRRCFLALGLLMERAQTFFLEAWHSNSTAQEIRLCSLHSQQQFGTIEDSEVKNNGTGYDSR
jgi:hypothetical protein